MVGPGTGRSCGPKAKKIQNKSGRIYKKARGFHTISQGLVRLMKPFAAGSVQFAFFLAAAGIWLYTWSLLRIPVTSASVRVDVCTRLVGGGGAGGGRQARRGAGGRGRDGCRGKTSSGTYPTSKSFTPFDDGI